MSRLTAVFDCVESTTMTVSPKRTMLPPIWVAACDSQRRRNAAVAEDREARLVAPASAAGSAIVAPRNRPSVVGTAGLGGERITAAVSAGSPRSSKPTSRRSRRRRQQDVAAAGPAAQADVGAEPIDVPGVAAARVGPAQPDDVAEQQREDGLGSGIGGSGYQSRGGRGRHEVRGPSPAARAGRPG